MPVKDLMNIAEYDFVLPCHILRHGLVVQTADWAHDLQ